MSMMKMSRMIGAALLVVGAMAARADDQARLDPGRAGGEVCREDIERFCGDVLPGGGRIGDCLKEIRERDVSAPCRAYVRAGDKRLRRQFLNAIDAAWTRPPRPKVAARDQGLPILESERVDFDEIEGWTRTIVAHLRNGKTANLRFQEDDGEPDLSPDGRFLALSRHDGRFGLYLLDLEDGNIRRDVDLEPGEAEKSKSEIREHRRRRPVGLGRGIWSPDSRRVALTVCDPALYPDETRLFIDEISTGSYRSADVSSVKLLGSKCEVYDPAWSLDGSRLAVVEVEATDSTHEPRRVAVFAGDGTRKTSFDLPRAAFGLRLDWQESGDLALVLENGRRIVLKIGP